MTDASRPLTDIRETMLSQIKDKALFEKAKTCAFDYMDQVADRRVYPSPQAIARLEVFDTPLPDVPQDPLDILQRLHEYGSPATVASTGGRYFGFVNGAAVPVGLAARWLADVWDQNPALFVMSPVVSKLETVCENWLKELFGLPSQTRAGFVSGTSTATLCGLAAARWSLLNGQSWDVNKQGMGNAPKIRVILGEQAHGSVYKQLALLGIGTHDLEHVPTDEQGGMDPDRLPPLDNRCLVIAQAGNVHSGGFDALEAVCEKSAKAGAWVHVDGAFGLWASACPETRHLASGMEKADSWSVDAHKTLNAPYDCGIILCKNAEALHASLQLSGAYVQYSDQRDGMMYTPEMSRRGRAVELWAILNFLGKQGVADLVAGLCRRAKLMARLLSERGFHVLNQVVFNQVVVACDFPEETKAVLDHIQASEDLWCGGSVWKDRPVIRISVCSWATGDNDIERAASAFAGALESVRAGQSLA